MNHAKPRLAVPDKAANWLLRARLYLNAEVYTGKADYANARDYADKVINSSYKLCPEYRLLFMADNDEKRTGDARNYPAYPPGWYQNT